MMRTNGLGPFDQKIPGSIPCSAGENMSIVAESLQRIRGMYVVEMSGKNTVPSSAILPTLSTVFFR